MIIIEMILIKICSVPYELFYYDKKGQDEALPCSQ